MSGLVGVIGDVHGELGKLRSVVQLAAPTVDELVFVGDYINRGPDSAGVLNLLVELQDSGLSCTFLFGNHERALVRALDGGGFDEFLHMGGAATIRSYVGAAVPDVEAQFRAAVPWAHIRFLKGLVDQYTRGGLFVAHAPPDRIERAGEQPPFSVFGHIPQRTLTPTMKKHVALIDTGCGTWPDGRLTCLFWPTLAWVQDGDA